MRGRLAPPTLGDARRLPRGRPRELYGRAPAENKGRHGIIASHGLDGRAVSAADALRNVTGGERTRRGVWNYHQGDAERHGRRDGSSRCEKKMHRVKYIEKKLILKPHILNFRLRRYGRPQSGPGCRIDSRSGKSARIMMDTWSVPMWYGSCFTVGYGLNDGRAPRARSILTYNLQSCSPALGLLPVLHDDHF